MADLDDQEGAPTGIRDQQLGDFLAELGRARREPGRLAFLLKNIERIVPALKEYDLSPAYAEIALGYVQQAHESDRERQDPAFEMYREQMDLAQHYKSQAGYGSTKDAMPSDDDQSGMSLERILDITRRLADNARQRPDIASAIVANLEKVYSNVATKIDLQPIHAEIALGYSQQSGKSPKDSDEYSRLTSKADYHWQKAGLTKPEPPRDQGRETVQ